jgi:A/G-specific adenine glycosylase
MKSSELWDEEQKAADTTLSAAVILWQKEYGRHDLPWQNTKDAYRIWLSEIMLQQTQVNTVISYYTRFLERFPDVMSLASASLEEVMPYWSGLGYYARARNLHLCAQYVAQYYHGQFPKDPELLSQLPGIGRSTAAAIAAFAYGVRAAILDGNVKRVFSRVLGIEEDIRIKSVEDRLWLHANTWLPQSEMVAYTQGLMDLGAMVCTRNKPGCLVCPLKTHCVAFEKEKVHLIPYRSLKKEQVKKQVVMLVVSDESQVLLQHRTESGVWNGLFSLPEVGGQNLLGEEGVCEPTFPDAILAAGAKFGDVIGCDKLTPFVHTFTHFKLHVLPYHVKVVRNKSAKLGRPYVWCAKGRIEEMALPAPVKKLLRGLFMTQDLFSPTKKAVVKKQFEQLSLLS